VSRSLILTVTDEPASDEPGAGVVLEVVGYSEQEVLESLIRTTEAVIQRQIREQLGGTPYYEGMSSHQLDGFISMQARLSLVEVLTSLDFVSSVGISIDL